MIVSKCCGIVAKYIALTNQLRTLCPLQWDILSNTGVVEEMFHIAKGHDPGNCVSLLRVNVCNIYICVVYFPLVSCSDLLHLDVFCFLRVENCHCSRSMRTKATCSSFKNVALTNHVRLSCMHLWT